MKTKWFYSLIVIALFTLFWNSYGDVPKSPSNFVILKKTFPEYGSMVTYLSLQWKDNSQNEEGFFLYRSTDGTKPQNPFIILPANAQYFEDSSANGGDPITGGVMYYYWLTSFNQNGESQPINDNNWPVINYKVSNLHINAVTDTSITWEWDAAPNVAFYYIRIWPFFDQGIIEQVDLDKPLVETKFTKTGLQPNQYYQATVNVMFQARGPASCWSEKVGIVTQSYSYQLSQNYPNPFNSSTRINYSIPSPALINLSVYDYLGRKIVTLFNGQEVPGDHSVVFNAGDLPGGVYFVRLKANKFAKTIKMQLLK